MATLKLALLGALQAQLNGQTIEDLRTNKVQALLIYLAAARGTAHRREHLMTLLWPGMPEKSARHNLRQVLYQLRQTFPEVTAQDGVVPLMLAARGTVQLNPAAAVEVDLDRFAALFAATENHEHTDLSSCDTCRTALEEAVILYRGDFLADFYLEDSAPFEEWATAQREYYRQEVLGALDTLATSYLQERDYEQAQTYAARQLTIDNLRESAHRQLMAALVGLERRPEALRQFEILHQLLADELGVAPAAKTQQLYEQLMQGDLPAIRTGDETEHGREARLVGASPYRGLAAFREEDAQFFFGREEFTEKLFQAVHDQPLVAVIVGSSGSGKSSAIYAGLLPKLREADKGHWLIADCRPGSQPFQALAAALLPLLEPGLGETDQLIETRKLGDALRVGDVILSDVITRTLGKSEGANRMLLLVDQFEELYTLCTDEEVRQGFQDELLATVSNSESERNPRLVLLHTLRADFMGQVLTHRPFADALQDASLIMGPMNREELQAAIEKPAALQGAAFEPGLVDRLLDDVGEAPGNLPLLEFALTLLWERLDEGWLTHAAYEEIGRVEGALARFADEVYTRLEADEQEAARQVFVQLVQPGEGTEDTRRVASRGEVGDGQWPLIQHLADQRLLVTGRDATSGYETVEVVHEALIQRWDRLLTWMEADRAFRSWQERLRVALRGWETSERDEGALLRGIPLGEAEFWLIERGDELSAVERDFIQACQEAREQREAAETERQARETGLEQRSRRFLRGLVGIFALATVVALILSAVAFNQREAARESNRIARAGELGAAAMSLVDQQPDLALLLSAEAYRQSGTLQNWTNLYAVGTHNPQLNRVMRGHKGRVESVSYSPNGKLLASGGVDGTVRLWDMDPASEDYGSDIVLPHELDTLVFESVAISFDGRLLAASTTDGHVLLWDIDPMSPKYTQLLKDRVTEELIPGRSWVAFSPTSPVLAAVPKSGQVELIDVDLNSPTFGEQLGGFLEGNLYDSVAFSPDGKTLAVGEIVDGFVFLWRVDLDDPNLGQELEALTGFDTCVESVEFSPDGKLLAAGLCDQTTWLWNVENESPTFGEHLMTLEGQEWIVLNISFSPDGKRLASVGGWDETALLWDVDPDSPTFGEQVGPPLRQGSFVDSVAFSPDGESLAVGAADGGVMVWNVAQDETIIVERNEAGNLGQVAESDSQFPHPLETLLLGHIGVVEGVAFSPNSKILASASGGSSDMGGGTPDNTVRLWDIEPDSPTFGQQVGESLEGHEAWVTGLAYDPSGKRLATSSGDRAVRLWDVAPDSPTFGQTLGKPMEGHNTDVMDVAFSPNGRIVASGDLEGMVYLWDVDSGSATFNKILTGPLTGTETTRIESLVFSPDGAYLATGPHGDWNWGASKYDAIRLWDADPESPGFGELVVELWGGHTGGINRVAFHPNGKILASASDDETVRLWDVDPDSPSFGQVLGEPLVAGHQVFGLAFSPEGDYLASGTLEVGLLHLWDVNPSSPTFGQPLGVPLNQEDIYVISMAYSPDGNFFAVGDYDHRIHLWNVDPAAWIEHNCNRAGRNLTESEWNQYLSWAGPYDPDYKTCPQWQ